MTKESPKFRALVAVYLATSLALLWASTATAAPRVRSGEFVVIEDANAPLAAQAQSRGGKVVSEIARAKSRHGKRVRLLREQSANSSLSEGNYDPAAVRAWCALHAPTAQICEPNFIVEASVVPNDPQYNQLYGMAKIGAPAAWNTRYDSTSVIVAVIDTGVDYTHPDLAANMWVNPGEIAGNGIDDDGNGYIDDIYGINAINNSGNPMDDNNHGTHCAGTIGGRGNNNIGVAGVAWEAKIMALKFLSATGSGSTFDAVTAVQYAVSNGAKVISASWGGGGYSQALFNAISEAQDAGVVFVAAAGNESNDNDAAPSYPASYALENIVAVAATDQNDELAWFSNIGATSVDIAAPGVAIVSTIAGGGYASFSGTSMATPHVAGMMTILAAEFPGDTISQRITRLYNGGDPIAGLNGMVYTGRRANLAAALTADPDSGLTPITGDPGDGLAIDGFYGVNGSGDLVGRLFSGRDFYILTSGGAGTLSLTVTGKQGLSFSCPIGNGLSGDFAGRFRLKGIARHLARSAQVTFGAANASARISRPRIPRSVRTTSARVERARELTCAAILGSLVQL